jgi:outer membrane cobalamin receptor
MIIKILSTVAIALSFTSLHAETIDDSVVVDASYLSEQIELSVASSYRYIPVEKSLNEISLSELIAKQPGVQTRKYGGVGSFETVSIRGVSGKRVAVFLNGVPQQSAMGGAVDLSRFSGLDIKGVEVYRGITPARFGGNSLGGVINIVTNKSSKNSGFTKALVGSFGEFKGEAGITRTATEKLNIRSSLTFHRANNNYPYLERNGTPYNLGDDTLRDLENNQFINGLFSLGLSLNLPNEWESTVDWFHNSRLLELPASESHFNQTAEYALAEDRGEFSLLKQFGNGLRFQQGISLLSTRNSTTWTALDYFGNPHGTLVNDQVGEYSSVNSVLNSSSSLLFFPLPFLMLDSRLDLRAEQMLPTTEVDSYIPSDWQCERVSCNIASDVTLFKDRLSLIVSGAYQLNYNRTAGGVDEYSDQTLESESHYNGDWSFGGGVSYLLKDSWNLFANASNYSRSPSLRELYGYEGGVMPNVDLEIESGVNIEAGISTQKDKFSGELIFFRNYQDNLISLVSDGVQAKQLNIAGGLAFGIEQSVLWQMASVIAVEENLTWQHTEVLKDARYAGNMLPDQPVLSVSGDLIIGSFAGFKLHNLVEFNSPIYREISNLNRYPAEPKESGIFSLSFVLGWQKAGFSAEFGALNVLDSRVKDGEGVSVEGGYYTLLYPGRRFQFQIGYEF